jgi:hypothetical protein
LGVVVTQYLGRTALSHRILTGLPRRRLGALIAGLAQAWMASEEGRLHERRGHGRLRAPGAGPDHQLVFTDRVIATLVILRFQLPHGALAVLYRVDRSTITRAVHEIRPLLAARGVAVPGRPDLRLRTLADVFAYAAAEGVGLRMDGTEVRVRRPRTNKPGGVPSSRGRCGRTPGRPPSSPTRRAALCGPVPSGPAACTTRQP